MVISVRNCMVGSGVDTLYCARFLIGGAFDPFVVPPCTVLCESIAKIKIKRASPRMRLLYKNASTTTKNKSYFIKLVDRTIK